MAREIQKPYFHISVPLYNKYFLKKKIVLRDINAAQEWNVSTRET